MRLTLWTDDQLREALMDSRSWTELLTKLGLVPRGGSFKTVQKRVSELDLSTEHFWSKSERNQMAALRCERLDSHSTSGYANLFTYGSNFDSVKRHLPLFKDSTKCAICSIGRKWNGAPLNLQVDHINGDRQDNRVENLRYLCPNCHSQTDTFSGRLTKNEQVVNITKRRSQVTCSRVPPPPSEPKIDWPSDEELARLVQEFPTSSLAKQLGVSDVAIAKRCKAHGIPKPSRGFWSKQR